MILTTISTVTLGCARNVLSLPSNQNRLSSGGIFFLAGTGILISFASILWTWANGWRLTRRLIGPKTTQLQAANLLSRAIHIGVTCNIIGLTVSLLGAEQIVGVLAIKVLTNLNNLQTGVGGVGVGVGLGGLGFVQPLDILIVHANTNLLLSHFISLVTLLLLTRQVERLAGVDSESDNAQSGMPLPKMKKRPF